MAYERPSPISGVMPFVVPQSSGLAKGRARFIDVGAGPKAWPEGSRPGPVQVAEVRRAKAATVRGRGALGVSGPWLGTSTARASGVACSWQPLLGRPRLVAPCEGGTRRGRRGEGGPPCLRIRPKIGARGPSLCRPTIPCPRVLSATPLRGGGPASRRGAMRCFGALATWAA